MDTALDITGLLDLLDAENTIILPTERARRALRDSFDRRQRDRGLGAWEPPRLPTWTEWLKSLWSALLLQGNDDRVLLNRLQEHALWAQIVGDAHADALAAGSLDEMAGLASSALQLAAAHLPSDQLSSRLGNSADTPDAKSFASWYKIFAARCQQERLLPRASLEDALAQHARQGRLRPPHGLYLAGFERLSPAQTRLLDSLRACGWDIRSHPIRHSANSPGLCASVQHGSLRHQLQWALRWVRQRFKQQPNPDLALALILPDPAGERPELEPLLRAVLAPELEPISADLSSTPWHFSSGPFLSSLPAVQHALLLLRWTATDLSLQEVSDLLLSPFFTPSDPFEARVRFDTHILRRRELLRPELSLDQLLQLAREAQPRGERALVLANLERVHHLIRAEGPLNGTGSFADWTELTRKLLRAAGWPGTRALSPAEYSVSETWESLLDQLATLDLHGRRVPFAEFLQLLVREAAGMPTQQPIHGALLQISRLPELEGCVFDAALVVHATDAALPPPEQPHPLLGWALQHSLGLPGTDPANTHLRSLEALRQLRDRCGDLLLVAPNEDESGPLRLTTLAAELPADRRPPASLLPDASDEAPVTLLQIPDDTPLPPLPGPRVSGGARVLELQAACGFRAFASLRLKAEAPEARSLGVNARESGRLLHSAMAALWSELRTQQALRNLSQEQRRAAVERAVESAFTDLRGRTPSADPWSEAYLRVLQQRLAALILRWLPLELDRAEFTVLSPEQKRTIPVGPIELSVRIDRIDAVEEGCAFIDYKTGFDLNTNQWLGERPDAPQLPLYTSLAELDEVRGVAFARMRPGRDLGWISLQDRPGVFPARKNQGLHDLATEMTLWRAELDRLAHAFAEGKADVDPKLYPNTCQHCEQRLLCRLHRSGPLATVAPDRDLEAPVG